MRQDGNESLEPYLNVYKYAEGAFRAIECRLAQMNVFLCYFTIKVNVKKQRRFDRSTVIFKLKSKNFCMRLNIQSIIKMIMRY